MTQRRLAWPRSIVELCPRGRTNRKVVLKLHSTYPTMNVRRSRLLLYPSIKMLCEQIPAPRPPRQHAHRLPPKISQTVHFRDTQASTPNQGTRHETHIMTLPHISHRPLPLEATICPRRRHHVAAGQAVGATSYISYNIHISTCESVVIPLSRMRESQHARLPGPDMQLDTQT